MSVSDQWKFLHDTGFNLYFIFNYKTRNNKNKSQQFQYIVFNDLLSAPRKNIYSECIKLYMLMGHVLLTMHPGKVVMVF